MAIAELMKIVADENIPEVEQFFGQFGEIKTYPGRNLSFEQIKDADILLVRSVTKVNRALLEGSRVKFVGTCTIGMDHMDTHFLKSANIQFSNAPGCNADGVVQYDLVALSKLDPDWQQRKIGVIGCGNVGGRLVKALTGLDVECVVYDPFLSMQDNPLLTDLEEVLACDIICMHAPHTTTGDFPSHHMINIQSLQRIKRGAILLNAGRGGAIDNQALLAHLEGGADLKVVLDVWEHEPDVSIALMNQVKIATSHIAGYGFEGKLNGSAMIVDALLTFLSDGETFEHAVDPSEYVQYTRNLMRKLKGEPESTNCDTVNEALAATYDIEQDDAEFRLKISQAAEIDSKNGTPGFHVAKAFDLLRKSYPKRRELSHFNIVSSDTKLPQTLKKVGFAQSDA